MFMTIHASILFGGLLILGKGLGTQPLLTPDVAIPTRACVLSAGANSVLYQQPYNFRNEVRPKDLNFSIEYLGAAASLDSYPCTAWPEDAKQAVEYAAAIWSDVLQNKQTLNLRLCYADNMLPDELGSSGFTNYPVPGYLHSGLTLIPQTLREHVFGEEVTTSVNPDIWIVVNRNLDYYFGTDANPSAGQFDLVTFIAHEIGHGLGMTLSGRVDDGIANFGIECAGVANTGCVGFPIDNFIGAPLYPTAYDLFVDAGDGGSRLTDETANPGENMAALLTGAQGDLYFDAGNSDQFDPGNERYALYTPSTFEAATSYGHFSDPRQLMYHTLSAGTAIHEVGYAADVMREIGWPAAEPVALPVEWVAFRAERHGSAVNLFWSTGRETDNAGFGVEARRGIGGFEEIGWVAGAGNGKEGSAYTFVDTAPSTGVNYYRLRQTDYDQTTSYSAVVGVDYVPAAEGGIRVYPNPVGAQTVYLEYHSERPGEVRTVWYDPTGRRAQEERHSVGEGLTTLPLTLAGHVPGVYTLKVEGTAGPAFHRVVVTR